MYNYFNNSLWTQVNKESTNYWEELKHFRDVNEQVRDFCQPIYVLLKTRRKLLETLLTTSENSIYIQESQWNQGFKLDIMDCILMANHKYAFR